MKIGCGREGKFWSCIILTFQMPRSQNNQEENVSLYVSYSYPVIPPSTTFLDGLLASTPTIINDSNTIICKFEARSTIKAEVVIGLSQIFIGLLRGVCSGGSRGGATGARPPRNLDGLCFFLFSCKSKYFKISLWKHEKERESARI